MTEEKANTTVNMSTGELISTEGEMSTGMTAMAVAEVQGAILVAQHFPRNIDKVQAEITNAFARPDLAAIAEYSYPRGGKNISGKSIYLARECARIYGNIRTGLEIIYEDDEKRIIRGWAWDIQTGTRPQADDIIYKLIQRKDKRTGVTNWVPPDERDLRELTNRRGALLVRNCILSVIPSDLTDSAKKTSRATIAGRIKDTKAEKKAVIFKFDKLNISVDMMERYIGVKSPDWTKETIIDFQNVLNAIDEGEATIGSFFANAQRAPESNTDKTENTMADDIDKTMNGAKAGKSEDHKEVYDKDKDKPEPEMKKTASDTEPGDETETQEDNRAEPDDASLYPMSDKTRQTLTEKMNGRKFRNTKPDKNLKKHILSVLKGENSTEGEATFCLRSLEQLPIKEDD